MMERAFNISTLVEDGPLRVEQRVGTGPVLLVVFSGVGMDHSGPQPIEFVKYAFEQPQHHVLFVVDTSRSWLNTPGLIEAIEDTVRAYRDRHAVEQVTVIGNSMGGFMALALADRLGATTSLAISPQYSVHPAIVPMEYRWRELRKAIQGWRVPEVGPLMTGRTQHFIVQGALSPEMQHWSQMPVAPNVHHYLMPDHAHYVARDLRDRKALHPLIDHVIAGRPRRVRSVLEGVGALKRVHYLTAMSSCAQAASR